MSIKKLIQKYNQLAIVFLLVFFVCLNSTAQKANPWKEMKLITKSIKQTSFSSQTYNVVQFGAKANTDLDHTEIFKKAIKECNERGGGVVLIPAGKYKTGPIHLENNVNLHIEENAELLFSTNPKDYPLVRTSFEGTECMNYSPMIYAYQKNKYSCITFEKLKKTY